MSPTAIYIIVAVLAYLLGSIPFGYLLVKIFKGSDIRQTGSGNIGATNVARSGSKVLGILTLLLDAAKGVAAGFLAFVITSRIKDDGGGSFFAFLSAAYLVAAVAALCSILGHMFTPWLRFRGGKGVATAAGAFLMLAPRALLVSLLVFVVVVALTRFVSLGSMLAVLVFPFAVWFLGPERTPAFIAVVSASALLIIAKHHENIRRLLRGTENRFRSVPPPGEMEKHA